MNLLQKPIEDPVRIWEFLPQRPPFVLVDRLIYVDAQSAITGFTPTEKTIFAENGRFSESGMIETMAQSIALKQGFHASQQPEGSPKTGYLAAIKNLEIFQCPPLGKELETHVKHVQEFGGMCSSEVTIYQAQTKLKIAHGILKTVH